jgi:uncharacterized repeat protein (TIGR02543 family)
VQLTATAAGNYSFANWTGGAAGTTNPVTVTMSQDRAVTANFSPVCYTLTTSLNPTSAGSATASPAPNCNNGTQYISGTTVQLTATANSDYIFANWSGGASGSTNPVAVTMNQDRSITANFTQVCFTLTTRVSPLDSGTVTASPVPNCADGTKYTSGTLVRLTAKSSLGYGFVNWTGDAAGTSNRISITISQDRSLTANFMKLPYSLLLPMVLR